jgi:hypothetical protein
MKGFVCTDVGYLLVLFLIFVMEDRNGNMIRLKSPFSILSSFHFHAFCPGSEELNDLLIKSVFELSGAVLGAE